MEPLALCQIETIEIRVGTQRRHRVVRVTGHKFLDFAVHRSPGDVDLFAERWNITHLPSGRCAAYRFSKIENAAAAMIEIARLRNDWFQVEDGDVSGDLTKTVKEIVARHDPRAQLASGRKGSEVFNDLNGYAERLSA